MQGEPHIDPTSVHLPSPSYWPLVTSFGVVWLAAGFLIDVGWDYIRFPVSIIGGLITVIGVIALVKRTTCGGAITKPKVITDPSPHPP